MLHGPGAIASVNTAKTAGAAMAASRTGFSYSFGGGGTAFSARTPTVAEKGGGASVARVPPPSPRGAGGGGGGAPGVARVSASPARGWGGVGRDPKAGAGTGGVLEAMSARVPRSPRSSVGGGGGGEGEEGRRRRSRNRRTRPSIRQGKGGCGFARLSSRSLRSRTRRTRMRLPGWRRWSGPKPVARGVSTSDTRAAQTARRYRRGRGRRPPIPRADLGRWGRQEGAPPRGRRPLDLRRRRSGDGDDVYRFCLLASIHGRPR